MKFVYSLAIKTKNKLTTELIVFDKKFEKSKITNNPEYPSFLINLFYSIIKILQLRGYKKIRFFAKILQKMKQTASMNRKQNN